MIVLFSLFFLFIVFIPCEFLFNTTLLGWLFNITTLGNLVNLDLDELKSHPFLVLFSD